jgi:hypothetical protein
MAIFPRIVSRVSFATSALSLCVFGQAHCWTLIADRRGLVRAWLTFAGAVVRGSGFPGGTRCLCAALGMWTDIIFDCSHVARNGKELDNDGVRHVSLFCLFLCGQTGATSSLSLPSDSPPPPCLMPSHCVTRKMFFGSAEDADVRFKDVLSRQFPGLFASGLGTGNPYMERALVGLFGKLSALLE